MVREACCPKQHQVTQNRRRVEHVDGKGWQRGRTLLGLGFLRMSHMRDGSQKVVGPVPRAPMKPRMSPKKGNVICGAHGTQQSS